MKSIPLADPLTLKPFAHYLEQQGSNVDRFFDAAHLDRAQVEEGGGRITKAQVYAFLNRAAEHEGLDDLGYAVTEPNPLGSLASMGQLVASSATLKDAVETLDRYLNRWMGDNRVWIEVEGNTAWICNAASDGLVGRDFANQAGIMVFTEMIRMAAGATWCPRKLKIEARPNKAHRKFAALSGAEVEFTGRMNAVAFPKRFLARPLKPTGSLDLGSNSPPTPVVEPIAVLRLIMEQELVRGVFPTLEMAAEIVGISPRSLQRVLRDEGLTYRRLSDRVRLSRAMAIMREQPKSSVSEVAQAVSYFGANNFSRAFLRLTGQTPGEWRRSQQTAQQG